MTRNSLRIAALIALLVALGLYESRLRPARLGQKLPTGQAEWIWASDVGVEDGWASFFVYLTLGRR